MRAQAINFWVQKSSTCGLLNRSVWPFVFGLEIADEMASGDGRPESQNRSKERTEELRNELGNRLRIGGLDEQSVKHFGQPTAHTNAECEINKHEKEKEA